MVLAGAQPYYVEAFPHGGVLDVRRRAGAGRQEGLLDLKAAGRLDKVKLVTLTNCTFDGHVYDTRRVMEECLAIKPDLIFLWDEAWFGFARFLAALTAAHGHGARAALKEAFADPAYLEQYLAQEKRFGKDLDPKDKRLLEARLVPDPRKAKLRVYQTNSTHKSMSALRQGSMVLVADEDYHLHEQRSRRRCSPTPRRLPTSSSSPRWTSPAADGAGRLRIGDAGHHAGHRNPPRGEHASARVQILQGFDGGGHDNRRSSGSPASRATSRTASPGWTRRAPSARMSSSWIRPGSRWCAGPRATTARSSRTAGGRVRDPAQQDLAQFDPAADEHQQHAERRANLLKVWSRSPRRSRSASRAAARPAQKAFAARVKSLMEDVPDLPNFSHFHDRFRDSRRARRWKATCARRSTWPTTTRLRAREADEPEIDRRLKSGPPLVSAHFVIPTRRFPHHGAGQ